MLTPTTHPQQAPTRGALRFRQVVAGLMLIGGIQLWLILGDGEYGTWTQRRLLILAAVLALIPSCAGWIAAQLDRARHPSPRARAITAVLIGVVCAAYFIFSAWARNPHPVLKYVDEHSYAIAMQQAAQFRLWMPQHPLADFFEAQNFLVRPIYASAYFPGTALLYAPSVWLGIGYWLWTALLTGACAGLIYRIAAELLDGVDGILCALIFVGTAMVRIMSTMLMSQIPLLLLSLLMLWAWLRWRRSSRPIWWMVVLGLFAGWALVTRPADTLLALLPLSIAIAMDLRSHWRRLTSLALVFVACAAPFIALQIAFNRAATGSWLHTPYMLSEQRDHPQLRLGFNAPDPQVQPQTSLPQKLIHYRSVIAASMRAHQLDHLLHGWLNDWVRQLVFYGLPHAYLLILLPAGLINLRQRRWVPAAMVTLWLGLYFLYPVLLVHYFVTASLGMSVVFLSGVCFLSAAFPRVAPGISTFFTLAIAILCITQLPEIRRHRDDWFDASELVRIDRQLANLPQTPAVVLFHFEPTVSTHVEPVYNTDVAWPDDAVVIRAHDLGERNAEIFRYYAQHQPARTFYLYNRVDGSLKVLGNAVDLAQQR